LADWLCAVQKEDIYKSINSWQSQSQLAESVLQMKCNVHVFCPEGAAYNSPGQNDVGVSPWVKGNEGLPSAKECSSKHKSPFGRNGAKR